MPQERLIIVDGNALVHRAFHAIPPLTNKEGQVLNAVYGFTSILLKAIKDLKPDYLAVTFDLAAPTFRHKEYKEYKAKRIKQPQELYDQLYLVKDLLRAMNVQIFEKEGFEADDVIATLSVKCHSHENGNPVEVVILTGDMDTLQLIDDNIKVFSLRKGITDIFVYDAKAVKERYGLRPDQMIDYKALRGDPSDNIPGVKGIGEKTASELIQKFGTLEDLYKKIENKKPDTKYQISDGVRKKLVDGKEMALQSKHLVELVRDVPIEFDLANCRLGDYRNDKAKDMLAKWEFGSLIKRLDGNFEDKKDKVVKGQRSKVKGNIVEIKTKDEAEKLKKDLNKAKKVAICLADDGASGLKAKLHGLALTIDGQKIYYIPSGFFNTRYQILNTIVGHDLKRTGEILKRYGWELNGSLEDVMLMDYLLDPGTRAHNLANLSLRYLGTELKEEAQAGLFGASSEDTAQKVMVVWQIYERLAKELEDKGFVGLYKKMEAPLMPVLARMEEAGIKVDLKYLAKLSKLLEEKANETQKKIFKMAGQEFNIASPQQLKEILFDKLQIPVYGIRKGKTGLSTAASELEKMRGLHPIIELIFDFREIAKLRNTYVDVLPTLIDEKNQRIHTTFNQAITATGRLSSSEPNLQNIPIRTELGSELRKCFIAEKGYKIISADYSQIELRIVASLSNDIEMIKVFNNSEDIHTTTAAKINGVELKDVTKDMRQAAKAVNFGIIYGIGPQGLSEGAGISFGEAREFIRKYFEVFQGVKKYMDETKELAHKQGYVETLLGRRRYLPDIESGMFQLRNAAERMAINAPVQGTAADLIKLAMIEIDAKLLCQQGSKRCHSGLDPESSRNNSLDSRFRGNDNEPIARMLLQVHDELVFEVREDKVKDFAQEIKNIMESVIKLRVPVLVEVEAGDNWGETEAV